MGRRFGRLALVRRPPYGCVLLGRLHGWLLRRPRFLHPPALSEFVDQVLDLLAERAHVVRPVVHGRFAEHDADGAHLVLVVVRLQLSPRARRRVRGGGMARVRGRRGRRGDGRVLGLLLLVRVLRLVVEEGLRRAGRDRRHGFLLLAGFVRLARGVDERGVAQRRRVLAADDQAGLLRGLARIDGQTALLLAKVLGRRGKGFFARALPLARDRRRDGSHRAGETGQRGQRRLVLRAPRELRIVQDRLALPLLGLLRLDHALGEGLLDALPPRGKVDRAHLGQPPRRPLLRSRVRLLLDHVRGGAGARGGRGGGGHGLPRPRTAQRRGLGRGRFGDVGLESGARLPARARRAATGRFARGAGSRRGVIGVERLYGHGNATSVLAVTLPVGRVVARGRWCTARGARSTRVGRDARASCAHRDP